MKHATINQKSIKILILISLLLILGGLIGINFLAVAGVVINTIVFIALLSIIIVIILCVFAMPTHIIISYLYATIMLVTGLVMYSAFLLFTRLITYITRIFKS